MGGKRRGPRLVSAIAALVVALCLSVATASPTETVSAPVEKARPAEGDAANAHAVEQARQDAEAAAKRANEAAETKDEEMLQPVAQSKPANPVSELQDQDSAFSLLIEAFRQVQGRIIQND